MPVEQGVGSCRSQRHSLMLPNKQTNKQPIPCSTTHSTTTIITTWTFIVSVPKEKEKEKKRQE